MRLRYAYFIRCDEVVKDDAGEVVELRCSYDPATRGGDAPDGRKVKGTIHWVSAAHGVPCEVRLYDRLFTVPDPDAGEGDFKDYLNPDSLVAVAGAVVEPSVKNDPAGSRYQFERLGYFCSDMVDSSAERWSSTAPSRCATPGRRSRRRPAPRPRRAKPAKAERAQADAPPRRSRAEAGARRGGGGAHAGAGGAPPALRAGAARSRWRRRTHSRAIWPRR